MSDLESIYLAEPRLRGIEALVEAIARRDGVVPWEDLRSLLACFVGVRRDASEPLWRRQHGPRRLPDRASHGLLPPQARRPGR